MPYTERDIEKDPGAGEELAAKRAKAGIKGNGVPVFDVAGRLVEGFNPETLRRLLQGR